jgi:hypothetical protein
LLAARLPSHLDAGEPSVLLRDAGLALLCINMIVQALSRRWPPRLALALALAGALSWLAGVLAG